MSRTQTHTYKNFIKERITKNYLSDTKFYSRSFHSHWNYSTSDWHNKWESKRSIRLVFELYSFFIWELCKLLIESKLHNKWHFGWNIHSYIQKENSLNFFFIYSLGIVWKRSMRYKKNFKRQMSIYRKTLNIK